MDKQAFSMQRQQFESTFFQMFKVYKDIVFDLMIIDNDDNSYSNKDYLYKVSELIKKKLDYSYVTTETKRHSDTLNRFNYIYYAKVDQLSFYFRTLYRLFRYIESNDYLSPQAKLSYSKIVRAQLTESELFLVFLNAYSVHGRKFVRLIERFNILKHLNLNNSHILWVYLDLPSKQDILLFHSFFIKNLELLVKEKLPLDDEKSIDNIYLQMEFDNDNYIIKIYFKNDFFTSGPFKYTPGELNSDKKEVFESFIRDSILERLLYRQYVPDKEKELFSFRQSGYRSSDKEEYDGLLYVRLFMHTNRDFFVWDDEHALQALQSS